MSERMHCPACGAEVSKLSESTGEISGGFWFWGHYSCPNCWHLHASGTIRNNKHKVIQWKPACPYHGADKVVLTLAERHDFATHDTEWTCTACSRKMAVVGGKIQTTWKPYAPMFLETTGTADVLRMGGATERLGE